MTEVELLRALLPIAMIISWLIGRSQGIRIWIDKSKKKGV